MIESPVAGAALSLLGLALAAGLLWIGVQGLRGRESYLPPGGAGDVGPITENQGTTVQGQYARWLGAMYLVLGLAMLIAVIVRWA
jgi:hypothetical protein